MKIPTITNATLWHNNQSKNGHVNSTTSIKFQGSVSLKKLKKMPLDKKLSNLFLSLELGDIVTIGKNFKTIQEGLQKTVTNFDSVIKRILYIKHGGLAIPLAFGINNKDEVSCTNLGNNAISIAHSDATTDIVESQETIELDHGDIITDKNVLIPIELSYDALADNKYDKEDIELLTNPVNYTNMTYDFSLLQKVNIDKVNTSVLTILKDIEMSEGQSVVKEKTETTETQPEKKLSFKNVGGMDGVVETLKRSVLYPIKYPFAYKDVDVNKGILLYGKPGTGKTLIAEALAGESNATFIKLCGTEFESKWVGETEEKWRKLFADARENQPSIIFIDEFDAVVKTRGGTSNQHGDKVVNQILSLMSDLEKSNDNVFVIATTNRPETIDSAIMRSGRFGKHIEVPTPDKAGLRAIYQIHIGKRNVSPNLNIEKLIEAFYSKQFTGADVKQIVNEAHTNSWIRSNIYKKMEEGTLSASDMQKTFILQEDFDLALSDWDKNKSVKTRKPIGYN